jgi:hypothetical protein
VRLKAHPAHLIAHRLETGNNRVARENGQATMKRWWRIFLAGMVFLAPAPAGRGQGVPYWRVYKVDDGMHQSACISVAVAPNGKIVTLHRNRSFAAELDGYSVTSFSLPEPAGEVSEGPGGQLWATVPTGLLRESKPGTWTVQAVPEIAAESNATTAFYPTRWGQALFLRPEGLMAFKADNREIHRPGGRARRRIMDHRRTRSGPDTETDRRHPARKHMERLSAPRIVVPAKPARAARGRGRRHYRSR